MADLCVCKHEPTTHARINTGVEKCAILGCTCLGYVPAPTAPLCFCGHMAGMHFRNEDGGACRFHKLCGCQFYRAIPAVPIEQLRFVAAGSSVVVVVVPTEEWDGTKRTAEIIAGDLTAEAHIVMVQEGPGLYYVSKHPEKKLEGGTYSTEETVRNNLLRLQQKLNVK